MTPADAVGAGGDVTGTTVAGRPVARQRWMSAAVPAERLVDRPSHTASCSARDAMNCARTRAPPIAIEEQYE